MVRLHVVPVLSKYYSSLIEVEYQGYRVFGTMQHASIPGRSESISRPKAPHRRTGVGRRFAIAVRPVPTNRHLSSLKLERAILFSEPRPRLPAAEFQIGSWPSSAKAVHSTRYHNFIVSRLLEKIWHQSLSEIEHTRPLDHRIQTSVQTYYSHYFRKFAGLTIY